MATTKKQDSKWFAEIKTTLQQNLNTKITKPYSQANFTFATETQFCILTTYIKLSKILNVGKY
jgi:hypothetical protein